MQIFTKKDTKTHRDAKIDRICHLKRKNLKEINNDYALAMKNNHFLHIITFILYLFSVQ